MKLSFRPQDLTLFISAVVPGIMLLFSAGLAVEAGLSCRPLCAVQPRAYPPPPRARMAKLEVASRHLALKRRRPTCLGAACSEEGLARGGHSAAQPAPGCRAGARLRS